MEPSDFGGQTTAGQRHNLADYLTSFVGREREVSEIGQAMGRSRLVTLIGAGGVGKTRLALRVGLDLVRRYSAGVWLIELAPLADPATIPRAIAAVLGVFESPAERLVETLTSALRARGSVLLVLDNCEHLVDGVAAIVDRLLRGCPDLTILATSREALGVAGETVRQVPSLSVPGDEALVRTDAELLVALGEHEATRLFVERASAASDRFAATEQNARWIAQICRRLDGIPLAIELAAARARVLTPQQIAARLDDRFSLLTDGSRTALPRQRTLRAAIDWSYNLLSEPERLTLQRLAVFAGGCTLEAAEAVTAAGSDTLDVLGRLVDRSLVTVDLAGAEARYGLLETIREYALEHLDASGQASAVRRRHAEHLLTLAEQAEPELWAVSQVDWLNRLEADHDNFRAALAWTLGDGDDPVVALRIGAALVQFWNIRGHVGDTSRLEAALDATRHRLDDVEIRRTRARALCWLADAIRYRRDQARCVALCRESVDLYRSIGDRTGLAVALANLGFMLRDVPDYRAARASAEEGLALTREVGDWRCLGWALYVLSSILWFEQYAGAVAWLPTPSLEDQAGIKAGTVQRDRADRALSRSWAQDQARAISLLEESLAIFRQHGDGRHAAIVLGGGGSLGMWDHTRGKYASAEAWYMEALRLHTQVGARREIVSTLWMLGCVAFGQDQAWRAACLLVAANTIFDSLGRQPLNNRRMWSQMHEIAVVRAHLTEEAFDAVSATARAMSMEQAVAYALCQTDPFQDDDVQPEESSPSVERLPSRSPDGLTPREREVAGLVGRGYSNRRIAEALVIAEKTAEVHARNIREKLGLDSRAQIAAWAARHGLLDADRREGDA